MQNFSFLARLEVAEKFVVGWWWWGGGPGQVLGSALVKLNNNCHFDSFLSAKMLPENYPLSLVKTGQVTVVIFLTLRSNQALVRFG